MKSINNIWDMGMIQKSGTKLVKRSQQKWIIMHVYICKFPHDVAEPSQETQTRAHILVQHPAYTAKQSQGLADQFIAVFKTPWKKKIKHCWWAFKTKYICTLRKSNLIH